MKYSRESIIARYQTGERLKFLFFYGHQPAKDGKASKSCFSQWWLDTFCVDEIDYPSAEHWMMAEKARLFEDTETLAAIIKAKSPGEAKKLGRMVGNFDPQAWEQRKFEIVVQGNVHKFSQNEDLKEFLLNTKDRILVEASPLDRIWGIGMTQHHEEVENPEKWKGHNLLGFALMQTRDLLIR